MGVQTLRPIFTLNGDTSGTPKGDPFCRPKIQTLFQDQLENTIKGLFTWNGGPRSSGVSFFCFHALGDTKQKKLTPLDRGPPLHVNRVLMVEKIILHLSINLGVLTQNEICLADVLILGQVSPPDICFIFLNVTYRKIPKISPGSYIF